MLKEGINFLISYSSRACKWLKGVLANLQKYVNQIDTRAYGEYTITEIYFRQNWLFQRASDMRVTCTSIFERQRTQMRKILIPFCGKVHGQILSEYIEDYWNHWSRLYWVWII